jgi:hypothetical protein
MLMIDPAPHFRIAETAYFIQPFWLMVIAS